jgi:hypothetical protein
MGSSRSMNDLLRGFSISLMLAALGFGALDLVLSGERSGLLKRVALVNAIWLAAMTAISVHYFFVAPTAFLVIALLIFAQACRLNRQTSTLANFCAARATLPIKAMPRTHTGA